MKTKNTSPFQSVKSAMPSSNFSFFWRVLIRQRQRVSSFQAAASFLNVLDSQPPIGGVPCRGSGGSWGRNQRHGESQSRFRPQQKLSCREAPFSSGQGVWGQHA